MSLVSGKLSTTKSQSNGLLAQRLAAGVDIMGSHLSNLRDKKLKSSTLTSSFNFDTGKDRIVAITIV